MKHLDIQLSLWLYAHRCPRLANLVFRIGEQLIKFKHVYRR